MWFYLLVELDLVGQRVSQSPEAVLNELFELAAGEFVEELLEVCPGGLAAGADRHGLAGVEVGRGTRLDDVRPLRVVAGDEHAHAVGPLVVPLDAQLHLVPEVGGQVVDPEIGHLDRDGH